MKLSGAIEECLLSGKYNVNNEFMCIALSDAGYKKFTADVTEMVNSIHPNSGDIPLSCALHAKKLLNLNDGSWSKMRTHLYCKQLYCWWVFDLKRKGL